MTQNVEKKWLKMTSVKVHDRKLKFTCNISFFSQNTVASVEETLTEKISHNKETPPVVSPMGTAKTNPMGGEPNRDPFSKPQDPQGERKAEEDFFNLM